MKDELHSRNFSAWVDAFRWMAALAVLVTHVGIRVLVPVADMPVRSWPHLGYAFISGFDHDAVMIFFVISGLLVGGSAIREIQDTGGLQLGRYLAKRFARLWIVLFPSYVLGLLCTVLAIRLGAIQAGILPPEVVRSMTPSALVCNIAFVQNIACDQFTGNLSLWSLTNEFWYYLTFPAFAFLLFGAVTARRVAWGVLALVVLLILTSLQFTGTPIALYMLIWGYGAAVATLKKPIIRSPLVAAAIYGSAALAVRLFIRRQFQFDHPYLYMMDDCILSALFGNMLLSMKCCPALRSPPWPALQRYLAGFSFSLYAVHIPLVVLYIAVLTATAGIGWQMNTTGVRPWLAVGGALALSIGAGWLFSRMTEIHTDRVRRWLTARWRSALGRQGRGLGPAMLKAGARQD